MKLNETDFDCAVKDVSSFLFGNVCVCACVCVSTCVCERVCVCVCVHMTSE